MKRLAGMQPYFFPYIGYWQLINAADYFVLFDEAQYIKQGWINRNRILKPSNGWQYIIVPLEKHTMTESIKNVRTCSGEKWKEQLIKQVAHYNKKAKFFKETNEIISEIIFSDDAKNISAINCKIIKKLCQHLDIKTKIIVSSEQNFDYSDVSATDDWALRHLEKLGATELINPVAGAKLFNHLKFAAKNINLLFLQPCEVIYPQPGKFEPSLSIIDVLMFNGLEGTKKFLNNYTTTTGK